MKKVLLFLLPCALLFASCSLEKRVYRPGWHCDKLEKVERVQGVPSTTTTEASSIKLEQSDPLPVAASEPLVNDEVINTVAPSSHTNIPHYSTVQYTPQDNPVRQVIYKLRNKYTRMLNDPNRMTYAQARKQMADKGCKPNSMAMTAYYMAWASVFSVWFGFGILLLLAALILSIVATNSVVEEGSCVEENLAIIAAAKRICFITLIWFAIITLFALLLVLGTLAIIGYFGGF